MPLNSRPGLNLGLAALLLLGASAEGRCQEPQALNPFGPPEARPDQRRDDAVPGFVELSDGRVRPGQVYLTRDARLKIFDEAQKKHREVPLRAIRRIEGRVLKEWVEEEWRFKENANDEKFFTGRTYPAREYVHTITLADGRTIQGPLSGIVYVQPRPDAEPERFLLHKRDKGEPGTDLKGLVYVRSIQLGPKALEDGLRRAAAQGGSPRKRDPESPPRKTRKTRKARP